MAVKTFFLATNLIQNIGGYLSVPYFLLFTLLPLISAHTLIPDINTEGVTISNIGIYVLIRIHLENALVLM